MGEILIIVTKFGALDEGKFKAYRYITTKFLQEREDFLNNYIKQLTEKFLESESLKLTGSAEWRKIFSYFIVKEAVNMDPRILNPFLEIEE